MRFPTLFLQAITVLLGIGALAFLLGEPWLEGRNAHATFLQVYFHDAFLAYTYAASIAFFTALYQAFTVLERARRGGLFSPVNAKALRTIKFCALAMIGFVVAGEFIFILFNDSDDRAGGVFMGILISFGSAVMAAMAAMFERIVQDAMDLKPTTP